MDSVTLATNSDLTKWIKGLPDDDDDLFNANDRKAIILQQGVETGKLFLLSLEEYRALKDRDLGKCKCVTGEDDGYWLLRSATKKEKDKSWSFWDGKIYADCVKMDSGEVLSTDKFSGSRIYIRPAVWIDTRFPVYNILDEKKEPNNVADKAGSAVEILVSNNQVILHYDQHYFSSLEDISGS